TGISIPPTIRWDGMSDEGVVVPDATYHYHMEAWDDNNNQARTPEGTVVVKVTPPSVTANAAYQIFSPGGDGSKETLPIQQSGSTEDSWVGTFRDIEGNVVRTFSWQSSAPPSFEWDGKNDTGEAAPDGVYSYRVKATDRAGNVGSTQIDNII